MCAGLRANVEALDARIKVEGVVKQARQLCRGADYAQDCAWRWSIRVDDSHKSEVLEGELQGMSHCS